MKINILHLIEGAKQATGLTVIIDVFRAFSTECYAFGNNAEKVIPVGDLNLAYQLKQEHPGYILMGERGGKIQPGFDYGNSPTQIEHVDFTGKTIVHTTSAGTQGIVNAAQADEIITGSFVNARAIMNYIRSQQPDVVSLVAMGEAGMAMTDEDTLCAGYLKNELQHRATDFSKIVDHLRTYKSAQKFLDPAVEWAPARDFDLCLQLNRFDFILKVKKNEQRDICINRLSS